MKTQKKIWEDIYQSGHEQKAPWDVVVSFVYRNMPAGKKPSDIRILEVGCGTASNLRFFAQQGFHVAGVDFSSEAIQCAKDFFNRNGLKADLKVGSFESLEFLDNDYDLVVDRGALVCAGDTVQKKAIAEIYRVLKMGGRFLYTPYADTHSSALSSFKNNDGLSENITRGTLQNVGGIRFMSRQEIEEFFSKDRWNFLSMEYETREDVLKQSDDSIHASWRVILEKI